MSFTAHHLAPTVPKSEGPLSPDPSTALYVGIPTLLTEEELPSPSFTGWASPSPPLPTSQAQVKASFTRTEILPMTSRLNSRPTYLRANTCTWFSMSILNFKCSNHSSLVPTGQSTNLSYPSGLTSVPDHHRPLSLQSKHLRTVLGEFPGGPVVKGSVLPLHGAQVRSLVGELRSHMLPGTAKIKKRIVLDHQHRG